MRPWRTANSSGVKPESSGVRKSAPALMSASITCDVPFGRRPHERVLPTSRLFRVNVGAARQQHAHGIDLARPRGRHQHRLAARQRGVRVGAGIEEARDDRGVAVDARERERRDAVSVRGERIRAGREQAADEIDVVV